MFRLRRFSLYAVVFTLIAGASSADDALRTQLEGKNAQERIDLLNGIVDDGKATKDVYFQLGNAHYESGNAQKAALAFEQAVALDATFFKAIMNLGLMYDEQQMFPKAIESFEQAAALDPKNPDVWSHMGNTYYAQSNHAKATELYRKALGLDANAQHALYSMGVAFADAGIFREAVEYWGRVVKADPQSELGKNAAENVELVQKYLIP
jgi:tetratricopeptide (TPR) repeat protein